MWAVVDLSIFFEGKHFILMLRKSTEQIAYITKKKGQETEPQATTKLRRSQEQQKKEHAGPLTSTSLKPKEAEEAPSTKALKSRSIHQPHRIGSRSDEEHDRRHKTLSKLSLLRIWGQDQTVQQRAARSHHRKPPTMPVASRFLPEGSAEPLPGSG